MSDYAILQGDCLSLLCQMPPSCIHTCVTSPPYFGLRDYGVEGQIGLEETPDAYVNKLVNVFREVKRVLRDDGTLWLNLGDSYASNPASGGAQSSKMTGGEHKRTPGERKYRRPDGYKPKDLIGIPWRVAFALQADGWYLRQDIIWHKPNPMPESVRDRCTKAHEYIFLLSKSPKYYFDSEAVQEPVASSTVARAKSVNRADKRKDGGAATNQCGLTPERQTAYYADLDENTKRNRRSVWTVTTKPFKGAHFATFPPDLIEPCVLAGCPVGGVVLDPFGGAGTTGVVAVKHGRKAILLELNPEYVNMAEDRIASLASKA